MGTGNIAKTTTETQATLGTGNIAKTTTTTTQKTKEINNMDTTNIKS